jgi:hypothetical protein
MKEATRVAHLFDNGLDGYYVDPEKATGEPWDWDLNGLDNVADAFCNAVQTAAGGKPFGITSHFRAADVYPLEPWQTFFKHCDPLLPQSYWRSDEGKIGAGPQENYITGINSWSKIAPSGKSIEPMAGELGQITADEIDEYAQIAVLKGAKTVHFYAYANNIAQEIWDKMKEI